MGNLSLLDFQFLKDRRTMSRKKNQRRCYQRSIWRYLLRMHIVMTHWMSKQRPKSFQKHKMKLLNVSRKQMPWRMLKNRLVLRKKKHKRRKNQRNSRKMRMRMVRKLMMEKLRFPMKYSMIRSKSKTLLTTKSKMSLKISSLRGLISSIHLMELLVSEPKTSSSSRIMLQSHQRRKLTARQKRIKARISKKRVIWN